STPATVRMLPSPPPTTTASISAACALTKAPSAKCFKSAPEQNSRSVATSSASSSAAKLPRKSSTPLWLAEPAPAFRSTTSLRPPFRDGSESVVRLLGCVINRESHADAACATGGLKGRGREGCPLRVRSRGDVGHFRARRRGRRAAKGRFPRPSSHCGQCAPRLAVGSLPARHAPNPALFVSGPRKEERYRASDRLARRSRR